MSESYFPDSTPVEGGYALVTMTAAHVEALADQMLHAEPWRRYDYGRAMIRDFLTGSIEAGIARTLVREADTGEALGGAVVQPGFLGGRFLEILVLREDLRGHGVGRAVVDAVCMEMPPHMRDLFLLVAGSNEHAIGFYRHLGFRDVGPLPGLIRPDKTEHLIWLRFR